MPISTLIKKSLVVSSSLFVMVSSLAAEQEHEDKIPVTVSIGAVHQTLNSDVKNTLLEQAKLNLVTPNKPKTRSQTQAQKSTLLLTKSSSDNEQHHSYYHSFNIYDAQSYLDEDIDYDGFYRTFSIVFDADVISDDHHEAIEVFADLYLSKNGGPWLHYFTTESFLIYGESSDDQYEVVTTLLDGYYTDYYDVLIDLYEVGYPEVVATISSDDVNELYALPLESSDFDYYEHRESHSHGHGGAISIYFFVLLGMAFIRKTFNNNKH